MKRLSVNSGVPISGMAGAGRGMAFPGIAALAAQVAVMAVTKPAPASPLIRARADLVTRGFIHHRRLSVKDRIRSFPRSGAQTSHHHRPSMRVWVTSSHPGSEHFGLLKRLDMDLLLGLR